jgi:DNA-binding MarR family transcriptional regulator
MTGTARPTPDEPGLGKVLKRAEQSLLRAKSAAVKPAGLTLAQYVALAELDAQPGVTGASLARSCLVTPQAMMVVLKAMQEQGLIERRPHPRHPNVLEIHLTDVGREALEAARQLAGPVEQRVRDSLTRQEQKTLRALLARVIDATEPP